jgi:hypothetical protein
MREFHPGWEAGASQPGWIDMMNGPRKLKVQQFCSVFAEDLILLLRR